MRAALLLAAVAAQTLLSLHAVKGDDAPAEDCSSDSSIEFGDEDIDVSPIPGSYLERLQAIQATPFDRASIVKESREIRKERGWKTRSHALMLLAHVLEHNTTDAVHREYNQLIMSIETEVFKGAETLSYRHNGVVLEPQREKLRRHASLGHVEVAGKKMPVDFVGDGDPAEELFVVDDFLLPGEAAALIKLHTETKQTKLTSPPLVCDTTGSFKRRARKEKVKGGFIEGFDCGSPDLAKQKWVQKMKRSHATTHYTAEIELVDAVRERVAELSGLSSNMGTAAEIVATAAGEEGSQTTTDCEPGGQYVPRKFRSATAYIFLDDDFEGGGFEYPALASGFKTVAAKKGRLVVQFNFAGQVCSSTLARREEAVVGDGTKHVLTIMFDNTRDETLSFRPFSTRPPDTRPAYGDVAADRAPYQPTMLCTDGGCRWYSDCGKCHVMQARNDDDRTGPDGMLTKQQNDELKEMAEDEDWHEGWNH